VTEVSEERSNLAGGRVVIVGAGAAGLAVAETLRSEGFSGDVTLIGDESSLPYDRPPLSKQVLSGAWDVDRTRLRTATHFVDKGIALRLGSVASSVDVDARVLHLANDESLGYDHLVIATGVVPRRLPFGNDLDGVHLLRSRRDVLALRETLANACRVVVIGAGFLGAEVASVLAGRLAVTLIDPLPAPMIGQLGPTVATMVADLHRQRGVDLATNVGVSAITGRDGRVSSVQLADGRSLDADAVLVAIGAVPATDWLRSAPLDLSDGVGCDAYCRAAENIYAAGDVASWPNLRYGRRMRLEHRLNATEQGVAVARNILAERPVPFTPIPYFWSDQFDVRIQFYGSLTAQADVEFVDGAPGDPRFVARYTENGRLTGVLGWNHPKATLAHRRALLAAWPLEAEVSSAGGQAARAQPASHTG